MGTDPLSPLRLRFAADKGSVPKAPVSCHRTAHQRGFASRLTPHASLFSLRCGQRFSPQGSRFLGPRPFSPNQLTNQPTNQLVPSPPGRQRRRPLQPRASAGPPHSSRLTPHFFRFAADKGSVPKAPGSCHRTKRQRGFASLLTPHASLSRPPAPFPLSTFPFPLSTFPFPLSIRPHRRWRRKLYCGTNR